jgi:hypothetical protein
MPSNPSDWWNSNYVADKGPSAPARSLDDRPHFFSLHTSIDPFALLIQLMTYLDQ